MQIITYAFLTKEAHEFFPPRSEAIDPSGTSLAVVLKKKMDVFQHLDMILCSISSLWQTLFSNDFAETGVLLPFHTSNTHWRISATSSSCGCQQIMFCPLGQKWSLYRFILASVYSDILFELQIPFNNTVSIEQTMFSQSCLCFYFSVPMQPQPHFHGFVHYGRAPWLVEDMRGVDSLMPAAK